MEQTQLFAGIRALNKFMNKSFLEPYCGLYKLREKEGKPPEGCMYVKLAANRFLNEQLDEFKQLIESIHKELNA